MKAVSIRLSDSDVRLFKWEDGYRYGIYLEKDKPYPQNKSAVLCVYRIPTGTQAPKGRMSDATLARLADEGLREAEPEIIARFPYWSYIDEPQEVPDDAEFESVQILPPSLRDAQGSYVLPPNGYKPVAAAEPVKEDPPAAAAKPAKG